MRPPVEKNEDEPCVDEGAKHHQGTSPHKLHYGSEHHGANGIHHAEADHNVSDIVDSKGTRYVGLERENIVKHSYLTITL